MKKILIFCLLFLNALIFAQENQQTPPPLSKNGKIITPQPGDWALGISTIDFFEFLGNLFNENSSVPYFSSAKPGYISGRIQLNYNRAFRLGLLLGYTYLNDKIGSPGEPDEFVKSTESALSIGIKAGIEKYKGFHNRLWGVYGIEAGFSKTAFTGYSNYLFRTVNGVYKFGDEKESGGNALALNVEGIVGVMYFFAPKVALSGEFGVGIQGSILSDRKYEPATGSTIIYEPGSTEVSFYTNTSSAISLYFYF